MSVCLIFIEASIMAEEVIQDRYQKEAAGTNDPVAAFLALRSVTETDNRRTKLRKLGNIMGKAEFEASPNQGL